MTLSDIEQEVVFLKAINELIDSVINSEVLVVEDPDPDSRALAKPTTHQRFFNIVLVDFLSPISKDQEMPIRHEFYIDALLAISEKPSFSVDNSISELRDATKAFNDWLKEGITAEKVWLSSIDQEVTIRISRSKFLKMCGNISKHNILRLGRVAKQLQDVLRENQLSVELLDARLALGDFYEYFHTHLFEYHSSTIAEFLNNIRWGIHEYLLPEFHRSYIRDTESHPIKYCYTYPEEVVSEFAKQCYWDLMNEIRRKPFVPRFKASESLKRRW